MGNWPVFMYDLIEQAPLRWAFYNRRRWLPVLIVVLVGLASGVASGWLIAEFDPIPALALLAAAGYVAWILGDIEIAYWGVLGIVTLLPFASLPFSIGFTPTFLDLAMLGLFFVWIAPMALGRKEFSFAFTPLDFAVIVFMFLAVGSFVAGLSHSAITSYLIRHFFEFLMSIAFFFLICDTVRRVPRLERLTRIFLLGAGCAALLGIVLYFLPDELTIRILSALGRVGYPAGAGVLRFIRDDPELMQRATSTSVDPNVLGSLLNLALGIAIPQLFADRPLWKRGWLVLLIGVLGLCLGLTVSRGSMVGAGVAILALGVLRYRKILPILVVVLLLVLAVPWTQDLVTHFVEGLQGEDLSTQMRFGEYKDALTLIQRYPLLGVGFAGAPDIDTYVGVASIYFLIAEEMGLVGLAGFLVIIGLVFYDFWQHRENVAALPQLEPLWYGLHAAILGGLVGGVFDHYFFSLDFHHSVTIFWFLLALASSATRIIISHAHIDVPAS